MQFLGRELPWQQGEVSFSFKQQRRGEGQPSSSTVQDLQHGNVVVVFSMGLVVNSNIESNVMTRDFYISL